MMSSSYNFTITSIAKSTLNFTLKAIFVGSWIFSSTHLYAEDIRADATAPGTQQPTVLQSANGVPQVNIQSPNSAGVSRNTYSAFDIDARGVILNNSRKSVNTQLGGFVAANPQMAGGEASVILNEINSSKRSDINGFIEVAGKRADVIVANPSGISCKGCGFINAQQGTLTTGQALFNGAYIKGYKVEQGIIELDGFNANDADYASIISRAVVVNGNVQAQELRVTTGLNTTDATNLNVQRDAAAAANTPQFSLDVKALGGMYAGKITLVGTEDGVGVRNAGSIGASASELVIRDGQLINTGTINSADTLELDITGVLDNRNIINAQEIKLKTATLKNSGTLTADKSLVAKVESIANTGEISSKQLLDVRADGAIENIDGRIIAGSIKLTAKTVLNQGRDALIATTDATQSLTLHVSDSFINKEEALVYSQGNFYLDGQIDASVSTEQATQRLENLSATIQVQGDISLKVDHLLNESVGYDAVTTESTTQTTSMSMPSWWTSNSNGGKGVDQIADTSNYSPYVTYLLHPDDVLNQETVYTPSGEQIYKVTVRLRSNDTVLYRATGCTYGKCEVRRRLTAADETKVLYFTSVSTAQANPDQMSTPDIWGGYNDRSTSSTLSLQLTYQNSFGNCTDNCVRLTQPFDYTDPQTIIARNAQHNIQPKKSKLEHSRIAVHTKTKDLQDTSKQGLRASIVSGGKLTAVIGNSLDNKFSTLAAAGDLTVTGGSDSQLTNQARSLFDRHTYTNTTTSRDGSKQTWTNTERSVKIGSISSIISSGKTLTTTGLIVHNVDLGVGAANPTDHVTIVGDKAAINQDALAPLGTASNPTALSLNASLFAVDPSAAAGYIIETDRRFTNKKQWLSSDFILNQVSIDPGVTTKRLGDGFYEQQKVREQLLNLTGRASLGANQTYEAMYQSMMQEGVNYAVAYELRPGVSLTAEQVGQLTNDIVWLQEQQVTLPSGEIVSALVPTVYLAPTSIGQKLAREGALITANTVDLEVNELLNEGGVIAADNRLSVNSSTDIVNRGGTVIGGNVELSAVRDIRNETLTTERNFASTSSDGNYREQRTVLSQQGKIASTGGNVSLNAGRDIVNRGASIKAQGNLDIIAVGDVEFNTVETGRDIRAKVGGSGSRVISQSSHTRSSITSTGNTTIEGNNVTLTAIQQQSDENLTISAANDLTIDNAFNKSKDDTKYKGHKIKGDSSTVVGATLNANNITLKSGANTKLQAAKINAKDTIKIAAAENLEITSAASEHYEYKYAKNKKSFGRKKVSTRERYTLNHVGSELNAGGDILINSELDDQGQVVALASGKTTIDSSHLNAVDQIVINADEGIELTARKNIDYEKETTKKKGFLSLSSSSSGTIKRDELLSENRLATQKNDLSLLSGDDITIVASNLKAGKDLNLEAENKVLIAAADETRTTQEWDVSGGFLKGGNFYELDSKTDKTVSTTVKGASVEASGDINIEAGSATVIGSNIIADGNINAKTDVGSIEILAAQETSNTETETKKITVSFADSLKNLTQPQNVISVEDGKLKISLAKATYDKVNTANDNVTHKGSTLQAGGNITLDSAEDVTITGSNVAAGVEKSGETENSGDVNITARDGDVTINESLDKLASIEQEVHAIAEISVVVEHKAVEIVKALLALKKSKENLKKAKKDYRQYKKDRSRIKAELKGLEQDYANKVPGVSFDDLVEVRDLIEDVESDKDWYIAGIALATVDVATKGTSLAVQVIAATSSTYTWGFDAGLQLDISGKKSESNKQSTVANGSNISGDNITINTSKSTEGEQSSTTIRGSHLVANSKVTINTGELNVEASKTTTKEHNSEKSINLSISQTFHGATAGGVSVSGGYSRSKNDQKSTQYQNSTIKGNQVSLNSTGDTNIKGANIRGDEKLDVNVGGDLLVEAKQDRSSGDNKSFGIQAGFSTGGNGKNRDLSQASSSLGTGAAGSQSGVNGGINAGSGRFTNKQTVETSLTGGEVNVDVKGHTQLNGAVIAATDKDGADTGDLTLDTKSLGFADLTDRSFNSQRNAGINVSMNVATGDSKDGSVKKGDKSFGSAGLQYSNNSSYKKSKTLATLGSGDISIRDDEENGTDSTERLNRDVTNSDKSLIDIQRQQGDFDVTITKALLDGGIPKVIGDFASQKMEEAYLLKEKAKAESPEKAQALIAKAEAIEKNWGETGVFRIALHTITGALTGDLRGAATALATAYTIPQLSDKLSEIEGLDKTNQGRILKLVSGVIGAAGGGAIGVADSVNQTTNNFLGHIEERRRQQIKSKMFDCDGECKETEEFKQLQQELIVLERLDKIRDKRLKNACANSKASAGCRVELAILYNAIKSYGEDNKTKFSSSEFIAASSQYGEYRSEAFAENAKQALIEIPIDSVTGVVDLTTVVAKAALGDEKAQIQLNAISLAFKKFASDPINSVTDSVKSTLKEANILEANGDLNGAEKLRAKVILESQFAVLGVLTSGTSILKIALRGGGVPDISIGAEDNTGTANNPNSGTQAGGADAEAGLPGSSIREVEPGRYSDQIQDALNSTDPGDLLEGQIGDALSKNGSLLDYQSKIRKGFTSDNQPIGVGEIDAETPNYIIEIASGAKPGKVDQLLKLQNNTLLNPNRKPVIFFAPKVNKPQQIKAYEKAGVKVINSIEELLKLNL